ncbi:hypothetical protein DID88_001528 [Monilinia fructigena]|uniref:Cytochrome P450 n=1 Tax=Monilinia fructigena TaxID=38457 RepID=A0A395IXD0_9HELO|nr:hypothetical protein DID88_001528 [Monilinia fructigena]
MTSSWLPLLIFDRVWHAGYEPFARYLSAETILKKPVAEMQMLNIHGPTVTGTNGAESRRYRRVTTAAFGTKTYDRVWKESIIAAEKILSDLNLEANNGICLTSPLEKDDSEHRHRKRSHKHELSYFEAFSTSASHMGSIYLVPRLLLKISPLKIHKHAWKSFKEWQWYMKKWFAARQHNRSAQNVTSDLLDALITAGEDKNENRIPYSAILGNIWVFILGGYHTSSNTLHFILILLAIFPDVQETLQGSLDSLFADRSPSDGPMPQITPNSSNPI